MSKIQLKKLLKNLAKEEIIDIVIELYDARKEAKEYLDFFVNPNDDAKLLEYKQIIYNEFFPKRGEPKFRFSICRKAISDFKKLKPHPSCIAELMVFYVELGVNFFCRIWRDVGGLLYHNRKQLWQSIRISL